MNSICMDTSAWIEITHSGANAQKFAKAASTAASVFISTISIYEITRYTNRVAGEEATEKILTFLQQYNLIPVSEEIAILAATLGTRHKLAMADSLIYATALTHKTTLWTQDSDFKNLPHVKYFPKTNP
ncbi:MAG: type II toxin-antitoxin system VapC family toxin [Chthoniobacterales bacterium]